MAMVATFASEALPPALHALQWVTMGFVALCCIVVGYPLSRTLSKHLLYWEPRNPRDPRGLRQAHLRRVRDEDE
jgi:hypothetical protein